MTPDAGIIVSKPPHNPTVLWLEHIGVRHLKTAVTIVAEFLGMALVAYFFPLLLCPVPMSRGEECRLIMGTWFVELWLRLRGKDIGHAPLLVALLAETAHVTVVAVGRPGLRKRLVDAFGVILSEVRLRLQLLEAFGVATCTVVRKLELLRMAGCTVVRRISSASDMAFHTGSHFRAIAIRDPRGNAFAYQVLSSNLKRVRDAIVTPHAGYVLLLVSVVIYDDPPAWARSAFRRVTPLTYSVGDLRCKFPISVQWFCKRSRYVSIHIRNQPEAARYLRYRAGTGMAVIASYFGVETFLIGFDVRSQFVTRRARRRSTCIVVSDDRERKNANPGNGNTGNFQSAGNTAGFRCP